MTITRVSTVTLIISCTEEDYLGEISVLFYI